MARNTRTLYYGTFIDLPRKPEVPATAESAPVHKLSVNYGALWVSGDGRIEGVDWTVGDEEGLRGLVGRMGWRVEGDEGGEGELVRIVRARKERNEFFFPGFIDTHIHAPQYPNTGIFGSSTLLDWLNKYTFPMESSFGDPANPTTTPPRAHTVYNRIVSRTLSHGTTTAAYYATIHVPATNLLASICHRRGQRALIGRVCMDNPQTCPAYYIDESPTAALSATTACMQHIKALDPSASLIQPIITPRFAPSCTPATLRALAQLASSTVPPTAIQTHISENKGEVALVASLFPDAASYTDVYDAAGLLTPRTILAHAVHLSAVERETIAARGAGVAHCPASNSAISSGLCPVRWLVDGGVRVGLGTDVSGGYSASVLEAVRGACLVSRMVGFTEGEREGKGDREKISVEEGLYLATRGGAEVVGMEGVVGGFEVGMCWDAQMVGLGEVPGEAEREGEEGVVGRMAGNVDIFGWESWEEKVAKWVWSGDDRNVRAVWVGGRLVYGGGQG
ncbi:hypothetical protein FQN52_000401 [Onygenales sp. PD_12]|nr:hypothetical protein FQN52_000401 [Onygenales sp. PD_12]